MKIASLLNVCTKKCRKGVVSSAGRCYDLLIEVSFVKREDAKLFLDLLNGPEFLSFISDLSAVLPFVPFCEGETG
jgi:hypothetical protein